MSQKDIQETISQLPPGSIHSLWLSQVTPYLQKVVDDGNNYWGWIYYFKPAGCCFYCQHWPSLSEITHCFYFLLLHKICSSPF